ncbi:phosphoribosylamine--glycine ligase [Prochlorococcus marinus]|uniref:Phosphoribosylamine--glycine ligase n=1 Tax=Prochlorococcus marinus (strain MIT 9211) TaxID=93059 RepID=A9BBW3_PROM4|nr:phosphoribosylamine--glycine ligase [Prochlorococcus marinus]ABX09325.1 phosphoribosylglycinamide synthetase [Prochlorococcus marinus str. MIT 9211]
MKATNTSNDSLPSFQRVLVVGNGGRENSLAWALSKCEGICEVFVAPGNGGTEDHHRCHCLSIDTSNVEALISFCQSREIQLVVIGPEAPLASGLADKLRKAGLLVFGPGADGAQIEASKDWAKKLMIEAGIPTALYWSANSKEQAIGLLKNFEQSLVIKADGLASGKGVTVCKSKEEALNAINNIFEGKFGTAGETVLLEECLEGPEVSVFALCDGEELLVLPTAQDHKRLLDKDQGPNTGGMGSYAPANILSKQQLEEVQEKILDPTLKALKSNNIDYRGVIYVGLMITTQGPKVIEFNCRFGDPECQALMPLMGPEFAHILQACAMGCLRKAPKLTVNDLCSVCIVASSAGYPEAPKKGDIINIEVISNPLFQIFQAGTKKIESGELLTSGGRVLSVVAQGNNFDEAFNLAYKELSKIKFKGMHYRNDIGHQIRKSSFLPENSL